MIKVPADKSESIICLINGIKQNKNMFYIQIPVILKEKYTQFRLTV